MFLFRFQFNLELHYQKTSQSHEIIQQSMDKWRGKIAVVSGGSSGIGKAILEELVKEGVNVVGLARRVERVQVSSFR